jgi:hypothetical protein
MPDIKKIKEELLTAVIGVAPQKDVVADDDTFDVVLSEYFNKASSFPKEMALFALTQAANMCAQGARQVQPEQVKAIIDKYTP